MSDYGKVSLFGAEYADKVVIEEIADMARQFRMTTGEAYDIVRFAENGFPPVPVSIIEARADDIVASGEFPELDRESLVKLLNERYGTIATIFESPSARGLFRGAVVSPEDMEAAFTMFRLVHEATVYSVCRSCALSSKCPFWGSISGFIPGHSRDGYSDAIRDLTKSGKILTLPLPNCPMPPASSNAFIDAIRSLEVLEEMADTPELDKYREVPSDFAHENIESILEDEFDPDEDHADDGSGQSSFANAIALVQKAMAKDETYSNQREKVDKIIEIAKKVTPEKLTLLRMAAKFQATLDEVADVPTSGHVREEVDRSTVNDPEDVGRAVRREFAQDDDVFYAKLASGDLAKEDPIEQRRRKRLFAVAIDCSGSMTREIGAGITRYDAAAALALAINEISYKSCNKSLTCFFGSNPRRAMLANDEVRKATVRGMLLVCDSNAYSTNIHGTVAHCYKAIKELAADDKDIERAEIVLITDGDHNEGKKTSAEIMDAYGKVSEQVGIHLLGIGAECRESVIAKSFGEFFASRQIVESIEQLFSFVSGDFKSAILSNDRILGGGEKEDG